MIATGFMIFLGVALILAKLPRRMMLKALKHDLAIDLMVSVLTLFVHWGSLTGVMGASIAGLLTSMATSGLKRMFGYIDGNYYIVGKWRLNV